MVDYFIDFVENQPENTWLHFHCKAGAGRTTTFMIMKYILILDDEAFYKKDLWAKYTCNSNIDALLYLNYDKNMLIEHINHRVDSGYTNINDPNSYTFVYVHVCSNTMDNVNDVVNRLNNNSKVRIVSPDTFIKLIINNVPHVDT